jgi:hypothetical protein
MDLKRATYVILVFLTAVVVIILLFVMAAQSDASGGRIETGAAFPAGTPPLTVELV